MFLQMAIFHFFNDQLIVLCVCVLCVSIFFTHSSVDGHLHFFHVTRDILTDSNPEDMSLFFGKKTNKHF